MSRIEIHMAAPEQVSRLPEIELRAAGLFGPDELPSGIASQTTPLADYQAAQVQDRLIVAQDEAGVVTGFAHMIELDGRAHLEELDVDPDFGRRGIGSRLVRAACGWGEVRGFKSITLATFLDIPWNAPFYARMGFEVFPERLWSVAHSGLRAHEAEMGLDLDRRVIMQRKIEVADRRFCPH
jgi:GNAT superfamily N-acetyltransferase